MNLKNSLPKERFVEIGDRDGGAGYFDDYNLETVMLYPFLSKVKTPYGRRWVLKYSRQSRSSNCGAKRVSVLLTKAKTKKEALIESARFLHWKVVYFENGNHATRGSLLKFPNPLFFHKEKRILQMERRKDLTQQINNTRRRLKRLKERRTGGPEAIEASAFAPLAQFAMQFVAGLDKEIKKTEQFIANLKEKRAKLK